MNSTRVRTCQAHCPAISRERWRCASGAGLNASGPPYIQPSGKTEVASAKTWDHRRVQPIGAHTQRLKLLQAHHRTQFHSWRIYGAVSHERSAPAQCFVGRPGDASTPQNMTLANVFRGPHRACKSLDFTVPSPMRHFEAITHPHDRTQRPGKLLPAHYNAYL